MPRPIVWSGIDPIEIDATSSAWVEVPWSRMATEPWFLYTIQVQAQWWDDSLNTASYIRNYKYVRPTDWSNMIRQWSTEAHTNEEWETNPNIRDRQDNTTGEWYLQVRWADWLYLAILNI